MSEHDVLVASATETESRMTLDRALSLLGDTREKVASTLRTYAVGTDYADCQGCALFRWLTDHGIEVAGVGGAHVRLGSSRRRFVPLPEHIAHGILLAYRGGAE